MKTVKTETTTKNFAIPGEPMTQSEFETHIKEAERGAFKSWEQSKKDFEAWRRVRKK